MQVGINKFKLLNNGKVLIETNTKQEIEALEKDINSKCGGDLEANVHKLRKPRLVIYNIPEDITTNNIEDTLLVQNPDLGLNKGDIDAKFIYVPKNKHRNLVVKVGAWTRKILIKTKIKIGWQICKIEDYVTMTRCFNCSRFNHRHHDCKGEETCPLCAGSHKLKECPAEPWSYKCINCATYIKHNLNKNICTNHSSLDKKCPSLQAMLEYRKNTDY